MSPTDLQTTWFVLLGVVWGLYLVLGGADLGVGMVLRRVDRATALRSIGPTWAANDVWLVIAVAATLGAIPGWYASWTSGLYLPLVVLLAALMLKHAAIELVGHASPVAARRWTTVLVGSSVVLAFGWGVVWAAALDGSLARGGAGGLGILSPTTALAGAAAVALCRVQGIAYLRLRVTAFRPALPVLRSAVATALLTVAAVAVVALDAADGVGAGALAVGALVVAALALAVLVREAARGHDGRTLIAGAAAAAATLTALFAALFPTPIAGRGPNAVDLADAASSATTLTAMLVIAVVLLPLLLATLAFAYVRFLRRPDDAPRAGLGSLVARATRGTLRELG
ncbi:cytochrome d ubiquinol oxidase subunit II [Patulibacter sp.]|uniref:cytochrome d ubiquinol oxidase subunit II n=1 Tax=Patulibacter sp. TaxID=1912859 RepID=UPI002718C78D|nr:cytochrome d ubiquinol oxidase subunit II [Patulibacter sp.]MDO9408468.1 cytochrome d ubiquinol oxidase subunit II [Patulibacter sp.]